MCNTCMHIKVLLEKSYIHVRFACMHLRYDDSVFVGRVSVNDVAFSINASARWDSEYKGFYYQLFFELWLYDMTSQSFQFHNRFVGLWLNMTGV